MIVKIVTTGIVYENCILIFNEEEKEVMIIDPGADAEKIEKEIDGYKPKLIVATHGHIDHTGQVGTLKSKYDIPFYMNKKDAFLLNQELFPGFKNFLKATDCPQPDVHIEEGTTIKFGRFDFYVIDTPGHSPGSVCLFDMNYQILITGDTLFKGSIGRTDLPGGSEEELARSLEKLLFLPDETEIIPGHGDISVLRDEKLNNFSMRELIEKYRNRKDFDF